MTTIFLPKCVDAPSPTSADDEVFAVVIFDGAVIGYDPDFRTESPMKERVFSWICANPGVDAEAVSDHFGIDPFTASEIVEELLNEGRLDFDE